MTANSQIEELIIRYFTDEINVDELKELETWIMDAPENKTLFFQLKGISDTSRHSIWSEGEKEICWQRMDNRMSQNLMEEKASPSVVPAKRKKVNIYKYAAVALIALSIGWGGSLFISNKNKSLTATKPTYHEIRIKKGGEAIR